MGFVESFIIEFVRVHYHIAEGALDTVITSDFVFDDGLEEIPRDEYLAVQRGFGAVQRFRVLDTIIAANRAAIMFEGIDSVTGLFHRYIWLLTLDGQKIKRVSACVAQGAHPRLADQGTPPGDPAQEGAAK
jgi:hypothetical protein